MNISQLARQQQMMYRFASQNSDYASQIRAQTQSLGLDASGSAKDGNKVDPDSLLRQMGIDGLKGRTVREMAKYQIETQENGQTAAASDAVSSLAQQFSIRGQYTPISDEATAAMQNLALQDAMNSVGNASASDSKERVSLIQEHLKSVDPSKRTAAFNTMNKVWQSELDRIGEYIKGKDSSWNNWGDKFDPNLLNDYKPGVNIWV